MRGDKILGAFRKRSLPIAADYRPLYKIGLISIILKKVCIGNKSSLNKLHFFIWSLKSRRNIDFMKSIIDTDNGPEIISWGVEPALNKALNYCLSEGLLVMDGDKYLLTKEGSDFAKRIEKDTELFSEEKAFLDYLGKRRVTESYINHLTEKISN